MSNSASLDVNNNNNPPSVQADEGPKSSEPFDLMKVDPQLATWLDDVIRRMNSLYKSEEKLSNTLSFPELVTVIRGAEALFWNDSCLVEAEAPIKVVGDIHAQYQDLNRLFDITGRVPEERFMFLGDYVDRGPQGIEVVILLFALKMRWRDRIYLLRGNHETPSVNKIYGFFVECQNKFGPHLWWEFTSCFNRMPLAGLISKRIICMHGGLSPEISTLDQIRNLTRPCEPLERGPLIDLLWADPTNRGEGWFHSIRGISYMFGKAVVEQFCKLNNLDMIIRAHQVVQDGYEVMSGRRLITVFSVPNYCAQFTNAAAVVCVNANLEVSFQQMLPPPLPPGTKAKAAPGVANDPNPEGAKADKEFLKPFPAAQPTA